MKIDIESICLTDQFDFITYEQGMGIEIIETSELDNELDRIRVKQGWKPLFDESMEYDPDGWYTFLVELDAKSKSIDYISGCAEYIQENDNTCYQISIDNGEELYQRIVELLREKGNEVI